VEHRVWNLADILIMIGIWEGTILKVCLVDNHHARKYKDEKSIDSLNQETTFEYRPQTCPSKLFLFEARTSRVRILNCAH
jgi:hypothetical protein